MTARHLPPEHPRAIFAGDADREMEARRAGRFPPPSRLAPPAPPPAPQLGRNAHPAPEHEQPQEPDLDALRARAASLAPPAQERREGPDPGEIIADLARADGTVLRVAVKRWRDPAKPGPGVPYVDLRLWQSGEPGSWPVKGKGVSVKPRELAALAGALLDAAEKLSRERGAR